MRLTRRLSLVEGSTYCLLFQSKYLNRLNRYSRNCFNLLDNSTQFLFTKTSFIKYLFITVQEDYKTERLISTLYCWFSYFKVARKRSYVYLQYSEISSDNPLDLIKASLCYVFRAEAFAVIAENL